MVGDTINILTTFVSAIAGIWFTSAGFIGYLISHLNLYQRVAYIIGGLFLLLPSQAFEQAYLIELAGAALCCTILIQEVSKKKNK